jgi:hypothetical protein
MRASNALGLLLTASTALALEFCHPPENPPIPPPKPTNPTTALLAGDPSSRSPLELLDASIVIDGGVGWDGAGFELDTGVGLTRAAASR